MNDRPTPTRRFRLEDGWSDCPPGQEGYLESQWAPRVVGDDKTQMPSGYQCRELPFYEGVQLVRAWFEGGAVHDWVCALHGRHGVYPLVSTDGIHAANRQETLRLDDHTAADYALFFCRFTRTRQGVFRIVEAPADLNCTHSPAGTEKVTAEQHPVPFSELSPAGLHALLEPPTTERQPDAEAWQVQATLQYAGELFRANLVVHLSGRVDMEDDVQLVVDMPWDPRTEQLPKLTHHAATEPEAPSGDDEEDDTERSERRVEAEIVAELMAARLTRALREGAAGPAFQRPKSRDSARLLRSFSNFVAKTRPVIILECEIPFAEELLVSLLAQVGPLQDLRTVGQRSGPGDLDVEVSGRLRGIVLLSLHEARSVVAPAYLAHRLTAGDHPAIIGCDSASDVPAPLRQLCDLHLVLPPLDAGSFRQLFCRLLKCSWPGASKNDDLSWVRYVQAGDFNRPVRERRLHLAEQADESEAQDSRRWSARLELTRIRERVRRRLANLDQSDAPELDAIEGLGEAKVIAQDLIADIRAAMAGNLDWSRVDRGMLLVGEPGTGKTMLARSIARSCGLRFVACSGAGWIAGSGHLGHHVAAMRASFAEARRYAPCILFIDELDSVGNRETFTGGNRDYCVQVVNALLQELQGFEERGEVFVIGATNHEKNIDPALRRPGRLDQTVRIGRPNRRALAAILKHHLEPHRRGGNLEDDLDLPLLAAMALGGTGADVARYVRQASRRARREGTSIAHRHLVAAITERPRDDSAARRLAPGELQRTAVHEAGHAVAALLCEHNPVELTVISVVPRPNGTLGFTGMAAPETTVLSRAAFMEQLQVLLAGRAAEALFYGEREVSSGAGGSVGSDLARATRLALEMVQRLGLGEAGGLRWQRRDASPAAAEAARRLLAQGYDAVRHRLGERRGLLEALAELLVEQQEVSRVELAELLQRHGVAPATSTTQGEVLP